MRITLHIGTHKTGTTFLQRQLDAQRAELAAQGVHYLDHGPNHSWLYLAFCETPEQEHAAMRLGLVGRDAARAWASERQLALRHELANCRLARVLISGEELCRLPQGAAKSMIALLREYGADIDIVCCVREKFGYAISDAQESIKGGLVWDDAVHQLAQTHFRSALETYSKLLGRAAITVFAFQRESAETLLANFASAAELNLQLMEIATDANEALSAEAAFVLSEINRSYPQFIGDRANPARANIPPAWLAALGSSPFGLPPEVLDAVHENLQHDQEWLHEFAGIELPNENVADLPPWTPLTPAVCAVLSDCAAILHRAAKTVEDTMAVYLLQSVELDLVRGRSDRAAATIERLQQFKANDPACQQRIDQLKTRSAALEFSVTPQQSATG